MGFLIRILLLASCFYSLKAFETHKEYRRFKRETSRGKRSSIREYSNKTLDHFHQMKIEKVEKGQNTDNYTVYYRSARGPISPLHDIPLYSDYKNYIVNMVVETPAWMNDKMQIHLNQSLNPIQRGVNTLGFICNYGALPQTWQSPDQKNRFTGLLGNGNPLEIIDIGDKTFNIGDIIQVKVLAAMGFNHEGRTNWKILALQVDDLLADEVHNLEGIRRNFTKILETTMNWHKAWVPNEDNLTLFEEAKDREYAYKVIADCNKQWIHLMEGKSKPLPGMSLLNTYIKGSKGRVSFDTAEEELNKINIPSRPPTPLWVPYDDSFLDPILKKTLDES